MADAISLTYRSSPQKKVVRFVSIGNSFSHDQTKDPDFYDDGKESEFRYLFPALAITRQNSDLDSRRAGSHSAQRINTDFYKESVAKLIENQNLRLQKIEESYCGNVTQSNRARKSGRRRAPRTALPSMLTPNPGLPPVDIFGLSESVRGEKRYGQAFPSALQMRSRQKSDLTQISLEKLAAEASEYQFIKNQAPDYKFVNNQEPQNSQSGGYHHQTRAKDGKRPTTTTGCSKWSTGKYTEADENLDLSMSKSSTDVRDHGKLNTNIVDLRYQSQSLIPSRVTKSGKTQTKPVEGSNIQRSKTFSNLEKNLPLKLVRSQKSHSLSIEKDGKLKNNNRIKLATKCIVARLPLSGKTLNTLYHLANKYPRHPRILHDPDRLVDFSAETYLAEKGRTGPKQCSSNKKVVKGRVSAETPRIKRFEGFPPSAEISFNPENSPRVVKKRVPSRLEAPGTVKAPQRSTITVHGHGNTDDGVEAVTHHGESREIVTGIVVCGTRLTVSMENPQQACNYSPPPRKEVPVVPSNTPVPEADIPLAADSFSNDDPIQSPRISSRIEVFLPHANQEN